MAERTALIVDPSQEVREGLAEALKPDFRVMGCGDGNSALDLLDRLKPDVLILELSLPRLDGIGVLRRMREMDSVPRVLVFTENRAVFALAALETLRVDYVMYKPTPAAIVAERVRELLAPRCADPLTWETADILLALSIPEPCQGYRHLLTGLPLLAAQPVQFLGKTFYLEIAQRNNATSNSVEKAIRDAIHAGWENGDPRAWHRYFPGITRCPQNKQFLTRLAAVLQRQRRCG